MLTITVNEDNSARKSSYSQAATSSKPKSDDNKLSGYKIVDRNPRTSPLFIAGIVVKNEDVDSTMRMVRSHIEENGCTVKSIRRIKQSGITMSVKAIVKQNDVDTILHEQFWPEGIMCRLWIENTV